MGYDYVKDDGSVASVNLRGCNKNFLLTDIIDFDDNSSKRFYYLVVDNTTTNMDTPEVYLNIQLETYDDTHNEWTFEQINLPYQFTDADDNFYYSFTYKMVKLMQFEDNAIPSPTPTPTSTPGGHIFLTKAELQTAVNDWNTDATSAEAEYGHISTWNVSAITNMSGLFKQKTNITTLDLSGWDTSNVESMTDMFYQCTSLTTLNLNNWNTSSLQDWMTMFFGCTDLTSVSMQQTNSDNGVWNNLPPSLMQLFMNCEKLTTISGIENWNTSSVKSMWYTFDGCKELTTLNISNWDVGNVETFNRMFGRCTKLKNLDLSSWSTSPDNIFGMFFQCEALTSLNLSGFDTSGVSRNDMAYVFNGCTNLHTVTGLSNWCVNGRNMSAEYPPMEFATNAPFANDPSNLPVWGTCPTPYTFLTKAELQTAVDAWLADYLGNGSAIETYGDISTWNVSAITDMSWLFDSSNLSTLDLSGWDTRNVTKMDGMFKLSSLTSITFGDNFDTSNVTSMRQMFEDCSALTSLDLSNFDTSSVTDMHLMFSRCRQLTSLNVSSFDTSSVTDMSYMFSNCNDVTSLDLSSFDTSGVTNMNGMFQNCEELTSLNVSNFDTSSVTYMAMMFYNCSRLTSLNVSNFDTSNVTDMTMMFYKCARLTSLDISGWCVTNITSEPYYFAELSTFGLTASNLPVWGTCP